MFSDISILSEYKAIVSNQSLLNETLLNLSLINRYESSKNCSSVSFVENQPMTSSYSSFLSMVITNSAFNQSKNSLELNYKHLTCENSIELFCSNSFALNKFIVSHSLFDCEDNFVAKEIPYSLVADEDLVNNRSLKVINLAPSVSQLQASIKALMNRFRLNTYAIVYTNEPAESAFPNQSSVYNRRFQSLAMSLVFKMSDESMFQLAFSSHLHNPNLKSLLASSTLDSKICGFYCLFIFLLLIFFPNEVLVLLTDCGQEVDFVEEYGQVVREKRVNVITLYDSPTCIALLNYQTTKFNELIARNRTDFSFLYKMVPVDVAFTEVNYAIYSSKLSQVIKANLNQTQRVRLSLSLSLSLSSFTFFY
jgi:hypothetical protein